MPKSKPNEPVEIRPVPPAVTQGIETVAPPLVSPAPRDPIVADEDKDTSGPDRRKVR